MDAFFAEIGSLVSLNEAETFANGKLETNLLSFKVGTPEDRSKCARSIKSLKMRLHPLQDDAEAQEVLQKLETATDDTDRKDLQTRYVQISRRVMESDQGVQYSKIIGHYDRLLAPLLALDHGAGRSNRARRAKAASSVFTANAGLSSSGDNDSGMGEERDRHGNMIGTHWDLGRDGAYDGLKVVILLQYDERGQFTGDRPAKALKEKGFDVALHFTRTKSEVISLEKLSEELEEASQLWLTSGSFAILTNEHLDLIVENWKQGMGLYIHGENAPFFVDANRLLQRLHPTLLETSQATAGSVLSLSGNTRGGRTVRARASENAPGFVPNHLLVTGIVELFEGITISYMNKKTATRLDFEEVLREHGGELVVVAREATGGCGPVIVDGGYTRLFCHWEEGGSSRFVRNCACWLSTIVNEAEVAFDKEEETEQQPELNLDGAFSVECSITNETGPACLLASQLADVEINTTDFSLDNNLALARRNMVLGSQPLALNVGKLFLQQGQNPFTRKPVEFVLPIVDLSHPDNLKLVTEGANKLFMGGRAMDRHSRNILLSVCEEMLYRQPDNAELLQFFIRQILRIAVSTPDMLKGIPGGPTVPLEEGLRNNITITGELVPLRKAYPHVARIVRLLAQHASEPCRLPMETLRLTARRSLLKTLIGAMARYGKLESLGGCSSSGAAAGDRLLMELDGLLFDQQLGIPIEGSAKLVGLASLKGIVERILDHTTMDEIIEDTGRVEEAIGNAGSPLVSASELTAILVMLRSRASTIWSILIEPLLEELKQNPLFGRIWSETKNAAKGSSTEEEATALKMANDHLTGSFLKEPAEHARVPWPGFVSPLGPSVYRCKCGFVFGNPREELTPKTIEELKHCRNRHFQEMFGADDKGYPTETSVHFPLHRAVQRVLTRAKHRASTERTQAMELDVAQYLHRKQRGNIHVASIQSDIQFAIDTYLSCRQKGMAEPHPDEPIDYAKKATVERDLILAATGGENEAITWVDPVRAPSTFPLHW